MAILGQIQRRSSVLIMIIALALFAFIIQGLIKNSSSIGKGNVNVVAEVDGRKISRVDFQKKVALVQKQNRNISNMQAMNSVWNQVTKEAVLNNEYDKLGIKVGEDRVRELVFNNPSIKQAFTNKQGVFDENALSDYIDQVYNNQKSNPELFAQWKNFENSLIEAEKERIYMDLVKAAINPTIKEGEDLYHYENDAVDFKYAAVPYTSIPDSVVSVTKQDISGYVQKHEDRFKVEEGRDIEYVFIPLVPSAADKQKVEDDLKSLINDKEVFDANAENKKRIEKGFKNVEDAETYAQTHSDVKQAARYFFKNQLPKQYADTLMKLNKGDVFGPYTLNNSVYLSKVLDTKMIPDSAKAAHILIAYKGAMRANPAISLTKEQARKKADSILKLVKRNPAKFANYAKELSDGPTKTKGGDLGWFTYGQMVPAFNDFVFNGKKGKIGVVETPFGFHVIKVEDLTAPEKAVKLASIVRNVEPSTETENETFAKAAQFASEAMEAESFEKLAKEKGYNAKPIQKIGRYEDNLPGLGKGREIVRWAYNKDRKIGDVSKFDLENGHVIVILTAKQDKGLMTAEEASPLVKPILLKEKKAAMIKEKMTGNNLEEIAKNANAKMGTATGVTLKNPMIPGFGREPKVVAKAFVFEPKTVSTPIDGNKAVYVIETLKVTKAPDIKNYYSYVEKLKKERQAGINAQVVKALKDKADIEDNRAIIYQ